jgi:cation:H+ antiporter
MEMLADLIPESFFEARSNLLLWAMAVASIALLVFGADRAINAAVRMARALGMSKVIIGATIVSLGTTAPETFVSVTAAFAGKPGLALGNGVGSVICNMAMIFGIGACITRLPKDRFILRRHGWLQFGSGMLLTLVVFVLAAWGGGFAGVVIPRPVGMAFLVLLGVYIWLSVRWARQHPQAVPLEAREDAHRMTAKLILFDVACLLLGLGLVVGGSNLLVGSVSVICTRLGVPPNVLAVTLIAFGTSLPELVTAIASIIKGHPELLVGNIVGANILNVLFVVGASATAVPLGVPAEFFYLHLPVMLVALLLFRIYVMGHDERFRRWQGVPLVVLFGCYYATMMVLVLTGVLKAKS